MSNVYVLAGVAGVGKSTHIEQHKSEDSIVISSDAIRKELFGELSQNANDKVFQLLYKRAKDAILTDNDVFIDTTALTRKTRKHLYGVLKGAAKKHSKEITVIVVAIHKPLKTILEQNSKREGLAKVPETVVKRMYSSFQPPLKGLDCDEFVLISDDYISYKDEIEETIHESHRNKFHIETLAEHTEMVRQSVLKSDLPDEDKKLLETVAVYHDLGKSVTRGSIKPRNEIEEQIEKEYGSYDRFIGHENVSSFYFLIGEPTHPDKEIISEVILGHMSYKQTPDKFNGTVKDLLEKFTPHDNSSKNPFS